MEKINRSGVLLNKLISGNFIFKGSMRARLMRSFIPLSIALVCTTLVFLAVLASHFGLNIPLYVMFSGLALLCVVVLNLVIVLDITQSVGTVLDNSLVEKNNAHQAMKEQKFFYENILNKIPVDVAVYDEDFNYTYCNPSTFADKSDREWIIGKSDLDFCNLRKLDPGIGEERKVMLEKAKRGKLAISVEQNYIDETGNPKYTLRTIIPAWDVKDPHWAQDGHSKQFISFGFDVTSLKIHEKTLSIKNKELEKANFELDRFVYSASHDLKAPLSSVLGLINLTKKETQEVGTIMYLGMMERSIQKLDKFIRDLINFSRNSRLEVKSEPLDFSKIISERVEELKYMENAPKVRLDKELSPEIFWSDEGRISTILNNLISNSVKYYNKESQDPWIKIDTKVKDDKAIIVVKDNGIGIERNHIDKVFNMFYRATEHSQGSGLGLYIVKEAVCRLDGTISVKSVPGKGTEFKIILPNLKPVSGRKSRTLA